MLILIIGSAPDALEAQNLKRELFGGIVAINNAWNIRNDWDFCIFPDDFPKNRRPNNNKDKRLIRSNQYVPIQNKYGGFVYSGGTMSYAAQDHHIYRVDKRVRLEDHRICKEGGLPSPDAKIGSAEFR